MAPVVVDAPYADINGLIFENVERPLTVRAGVTKTLIRQCKFIACAGPA